MNARSTETLHVIIIGSADGQDTLGSLDQDSPEGGIVPIDCPDPVGLGQVLRPLAAGTRVLLLHAGDRVEPGYLTSVAQHGTGEAVVLTPAVTIRPDGTRDKRLQWRFRHGNRTADLTVEPRIFPDTAGGVVLTIPRHDLQDRDESGALHGGDNAVGAQTAVDDEHTTLSGFIAHITVTGNWVGLHGGPAVIRYVPQPPGPWGRIDHYRYLLGTMLSAWLQVGSPLPAWVHRLIIHRLIQVTDADRGLRYPSAGLTAAECVEMAQLLRVVAWRVSAPQIEAYCSTPLAAGRRTALVAMVAGLMPVPILPSARRFRSDQKVTYFYAGDMPQEQWKVDGAWARPTSAKTVDRRYLGDMVLHERIVQLPKRRIIAIIDGQELPVAPYRGNPRPSETPPGWGRLEAASSGLRRCLARLLSPTATQETQAPDGMSSAPEAAPAASSTTSVASSSALTLYTASSPSDWPHTWLYMDRHDSAGDNARPLYRYARTHVPSVRYIFVIEHSSPNWECLAQNGFVLLDPIGPGFDAVWNGAETVLLSDIGDPLIVGRLTGAGVGPNQRLVPLQHGVTMCDMWRRFNDARLDVVVCVTAAEQVGSTTDHISYTLTDREVWRTGFPRHGHLHGLLGRECDSILLAPTWGPEASYALESDLGAVGLLSALYRPWLELAAGLIQAGHCTVPFAHPKLVPHAPEWFRALGVSVVTGRELPETLTHSRVAVLDRSSVLGEGMIVGCADIVWDPRVRPNTDRYRACHEAIGAIGVDTSAQAYQAVKDVVAGRSTAPEDLLLLDAGTCARLTTQLRRDVI